MKPPQKMKRASMNQWIAMIMKSMSAPCTETSGGSHQPYCGSFTWIPQLFLEYVNSRVLVSLSPIVIVCSITSYFSCQASIV